MINNPKRWVTTSAVVIILSLAVLIFIRPVWGIDFVGGSLMEIKSGGDITAVRNILSDGLSLEAQVQTGEGGRLLIRTEPLAQDKHQTVIAALTEAGLFEEELRFESIGPTIGAELRRKAVVAIGVVLVLLVAYLAYTFRQTAGLISAWKFGVAAIYALIHDLLLVTAIFVLLGKWYDVPINTLFVTAMLAILGYSVNDTIVIFNRLKMDWLKNRGASLLETLDNAVKNSLVRSLNTSFTTLLVLMALLIWGGESIRWFIVALAMGTIIGTYSSLYVAPPLLYFLAKRK